MLRNLIVIFCFISLFGIIAEITVRCSASLSEKVSSGVFSFNKNTDIVEAKVLGYTFETHRVRNSPTRMSYFYAVSYNYRNERYFADIKTVDEAHGDYKDYLPLPEKIGILIDADNPQNSIYPKNYHSTSAGFWFMQLLFISLLILTLFPVKDASVRQQILRWKSSKGFKKKYQFMFLRLLFFAPLLFTINSFRNFASAAHGDSIGNYKLMLVTNSAEKEQESISEIVEYARGDVFFTRRKTEPIVLINKFPSDELTDCYAVNDDGEKVQMDFYFNVSQLYVKNTPDNKPLKYLILQTKAATYFVPLETIYFR